MPGTSERSRSVSCCCHVNSDCFLGEGPSGPLVKLDSWERRAGIVGVRKWVWGPILIQHRCLWELLALDPTILRELVSWRLLLCLLRADVLKVSHAFPPVELGSEAPARGLGGISNLRATGHLPSWELQVEPRQVGPLSSLSMVSLQSCSEH